MTPRSTGELWRELLARRARNERLARLAVIALYIFLAFALFYGATR